MDAPISMLYLEVMVGLCAAAIRMLSEFCRPLRPIGPVVQLDRISDFGSEGWGFESSRGH